MNDFPLRNWVPYKIIKENGIVQCQWLNTFESSFTEPFFEETYLKCLGLNTNYTGIRSVSGLTMLSEWALGLNEVEPAAFIFHISRCGSTLISQLLATSAANIILSEVPFFDDILRLPYQGNGFNEAVAAPLLTSAIKFYGQKKTGRENNLFIKTDSWHLFFYRQLRQLYPSVPFIMVYRSPDEVFNSHRKLPGMQAVRGLIEPEVFGFDAEETTGWSPDVYLAKVLESYFRQCLAIADTDNKFLLLNYCEGPMPMIEKIAAFTNTPLSPEDTALMMERSLYHSKKPGERFSEKATTIIPSCLINAMDLYNALEIKRKGMY
ncbi:MAG: hypothetical protein ACHQIM_05840 [Sphingobacteriales bacterium]